MTASRQTLAIGAVLIVSLTAVALVVAGGAGPAPQSEAPTQAAQTGGDHDMNESEGGMDHGNMAMDMRMVENGTIVNENAETLPPGCDEVHGERSVTIHGGVEYSEGGEMFSFDRQRLEVEPCTRLTVTFVNDDEVRHQWMVHGLPAGVHPMGMFTIEVDGPASVEGTFITPAEDTTLHTHCSLPQHEQKGMQMKVIVGDGSDGAGHDGH